jgi:hypothetical protein
MLPAPPLDIRSGSAVVWTGKELVVWGGSVDPNIVVGVPPRNYQDGAAYNPSTGAWRPLSPSPLPASAETSVAAMTERGVVIVRGSETALWDPTTNQWRSLPDVPTSCARTCWRTGPVTDLTLVGDSLVSYSANAALDVRTGRWIQLPKPPRHFERFSATSTGHELIVIGGDSSFAPNTGALAYEPSVGAWRSLPTPPDLSQQAIAADWDGTRVVAVDYEMHAAAYDPDGNNWSALANVPARFSEWLPSLRSVGGKSIGTTAQAITVLGSNGVWTPVPYGEVPLGGTIEAPRVDGSTTGPRVVFDLGIDREQQRMTLAAIDLDRLATNPPRLQVGTASIAMPDGYALTESSYAQTGVKQTVDIRIGDWGSRSCEVSSTYGGGVQSEGKERVPVPMNTGVTDWYRRADGTHWETAATTTDLVVVQCSDAAYAEQLVRSVNLPT